MTLWTDRQKLDANVALHSPFLAQARRKEKERKIMNTAKSVKMEAAGR